MTCIVSPSKAKKLLSLPPNLVTCFHSITGLSPAEYFCTHDPVGHNLGSGGGTAWLLERCYESERTGQDFDAWLASERRILIHAGGKSRRLPAYAPSGKPLTPIPVFRWERGQRLSQTLLDLQLPLYERIIGEAPSKVHTMIVSGDVYIRAGMQLPDVPDADVICYGVWLDAAVATNHGVFASDHATPNVLRCMMQKPSIGTLNALMATSYYLTDIGLWMLSDRAVRLLMQRCRCEKGAESDATKGCDDAAKGLKFYDLYSDFGRALGTSPEVDDEDLAALTVAVVPLNDGEFYHFGTSGELLSSMLAIQNIVNDQREIMHHGRKPHPSIFVQNAIVDIKMRDGNANLWIENSHVARGWTLTHDNVITGVPENDWDIDVPPHQCVDIVPIGEREWAVRIYDIDDKFEGERQRAALFPLVGDTEAMGQAITEMLRTGRSPSGHKLVSADYISAHASLTRLIEQRERFRRDSWTAIAENHEHSVFYQLDLDDAAHCYAEASLPLPPEPDTTTPLLTRMSDSMFRSQTKRLRGEPYKADEEKAFALLREGLTAAATDDKQRPRLSVHSDQIVWGRSPVRIDLAGGWTDTPPYCLLEGGNVVNIAIELNGQPPLQAYARPCKEPHVVLRSIDLGAVETISTYEELADFNHVGSPFSIPKAALCLAGFLPRFCAEHHATLKEQLTRFGGGIELTLLSAIPAGSGLGTSSILAATVLGTVSEFCSLAWDKTEIGKRTMILEQLLTTGGGWQDQFGGVLHGAKMLQTSRGLAQDPVVRWLPDDIFTQNDYARCHLLYYTGLTRTAKDILSEIVRRMFLNNGAQIAMLREMKQHATEMYEAIQRHNFALMGRLVRRTWEQNKALDTGTNPPAVERIARLIDDLCLGYKLPGAGGGGYMYMVAKDPEAAARIKQRITAAHTADNARFVEMSLSKSGLQVSRS